MPKRPAGTGLLAKSKEGLRKVSDKLKEKEKEKEKKEREKQKELEKKSTDVGTYSETLQVTSRKYHSST
jgi:hypothetical protein